MTVLFTDMVGSTALRGRVGEEAADRVQQAHDRLLGEVIEKAGGRVVKGTGDGLLAVFSSAADAVSASVKAQQSVEARSRSEPEMGFAIRAGLSAGDVTTTPEGDVHGSAVVEAARLCGAAQAGQILAADLVRALARGRGGFVFEPFGDLQLKGLDEPVAACEVGWDPLPAEVGVSVPFPRLLAPTPGVAYVGRPQLLARLEQAWTQVESEQVGGWGVLLSGEPGVGKTRTAAEVAQRVFGKGGLVLYGRCDEALSTPYEPFVEALDWQTVHDPGLPLGRYPGELIRLVPDLDERVGGLPDPVSSDPRVERHRLFEAVASWLSLLSRQSGLLLVVDDLHWAGEPTLQLLVHVLRSAAADRDARLLVIGTYRDTDVDRTHPLADVLGDLRRIEHVQRLGVDRLTVDEVMGFAEEAAGHALDAATRRLAELVHAETDGNPFFVAEMVRHLIETGTVQFDQGRWTVADPEIAEVPEGIKDVVGRRLSRLSATANELLRTAAVLGRDIDLDVLVALSEAAESSVVDALDEALRARLIEETGPNGVRFSHAIVSTTLYEELSALRRRRLHGRIVEVLERLRPEDVEPLVYHAVQAGPESDRALRYCVAAGQQALDKRAHADARRWFRQALDVADAQPDAEPAVVVAARCGLGEALQALGDPAARETLLQAGHQALDTGQLGLAMRAGLANTRLSPSVAGGVDHDKVSLLEDILTELGADQPQGRARVQALLAVELTHEPDQSARQLTLADEAVRLGRQFDDPALQAWLQIVTHTPFRIPERAIWLAERTSEMVETADRSGDPALRCMARLHAAGDHLTVGNLDAVHRWLSEGQAVAQDEAAPVFQWTLQTASVQRLIYAGDLDAARSANAAAIELGQNLQEPDALAWWGAIEAGLAWVDGTYSALADVFEAFADQYPAAASWRAAHIVALAEGGRADEARAVLEDHGLLDPTSVPDDWTTLATLHNLAVAAFEGGWADLGDALVAVLTPHRDLWANYILFCIAPVGQALGLAAAAAGRWDQAVRTIRHNRDLIVEQHMRSHLPRASLYLARILAERNAPGDLDQARTAARDGLNAAHDMGMDTMTTKLTSLLDRLPEGS